MEAIRAWAIAFLFFVGACSTAGRISPARVVVFNETGNEVRVTIDIDGTNLYGGLAATAAAVEPSVSFAVGRELYPGIHTITVRVAGRDDAQTFTLHGPVTIVVRIEKGSTRIVAHDGELGFM